MAEAGLGAFVKRRRGDLGMSQGSLAVRAGISKATISHLERGRTTLPRPEDRRRLVRALGTGHADLLVAAGEVTREELEAWARGAGFVRPAPDADEGWSAALVAELWHEDEDSPWARLHRQVGLLGRKQAGCVADLVGCLATDEARTKRRELGPEGFHSWRDAREMMEQL